MEALAPRLSILLLVLYHPLLVLLLWFVRAFRSLEINQVERLKCLFQAASLGSDGRRHGG